MELSEKRTIISKELQGLLSKINTAFLLLDRNLKIVYASNFFLRMLGIDNSDYYRIEFLSLLPERDKLRASEILQRSLKGEGFNSVLLSIRTKKVLKDLFLGKWSLLTMKI